MDRTLLVLDTTRDPAAIHLTREGGASCALTLPARNLAERLPEALRDFLAAQDTRADELTGVFVLLGPSGYTGTRIGITTAWAMHLAHRMPVYGAGNLEVAARAWGGPDAFLVALDAGRGELYLLGRHGESEWLAPCAMSREGAEALQMPDGSLPLHVGIGWTGEAPDEFDNALLAIAWEAAYTGTPLEDMAIRPIHLDRPKPEFRPPAGWVPPAEDAL